MSENQFDGDTTASMRYLNTTAIKAHALKCSKELRAGLFQRVGQSFVNEVQAEAERLIREINAKYQPAVHAVVAPAEGASFVTGAYLDRAQKILDDAVARIIQAKVQRHPSVGKTLL